MKNQQLLDFFFYTLIICHHNECMSIVMRRTPKNMYGDGYFMLCVFSKSA